MIHDVSHSFMVWVGSDSWTRNEGKNHSTVSIPMSKCPCSFLQGTSICVPMDFTRNASVTLVVLLPLPHSAFQDDSINHLDTKSETLRGFVLRNSRLAAIFLSHSLYSGTYSWKPNDLLIGGLRVSVANFPPRQNLWSAQVQAACMLPRGHQNQQWNPTLCFWWPLPIQLLVNKSPCAKTCHVQQLWDSY